VSFHRPLNRVLSSALLALSAVACSMEPRGYTRATPDPEFVPADSWSSMTLVISGARTVVSSNGHFTTVPNACYRRESGALDLELWNRVAQAVNRMLEQNWLDEPSCAPRPAGAADLYQPVILAMRDRQTRELLTSSGGKFCSRSADLTAAADLLVALSEVAYKAKHEGCPARGSFWDESGLFLDGPSDYENASDREDRPDRDHRDDDDREEHEDGRPDHWPRPHPRPTVHPTPHPTPRPTPTHEPKKEHDRGHHRPDQKGKQEGSEWWND
jgi:hypothetical protein